MIIVTQLWLFIHRHSDHGGGTYEVTNQFQVLHVEHTHTSPHTLPFCAQVQSPIPWLSAVLRLLKEAQEIAQDFTDKVQSSLMHTTCACHLLLRSAYLMLCYKTINRPTQRVIYVLWTSCFYIFQNM